MKTFSITTLGCRVNHYESEQLATLLRARGLEPAPPARADVRVVHTCSVTTEAASKSRQAVRRGTRLRVLEPRPTTSSNGCGGINDGAINPAVPLRDVAGLSLSDTSSAQPESGTAARRPRVVVTGCWATSDREQAEALPGVDAVLGHHQDVGRELTRLLTQWEAEERASGSPTSLVSEHIESVGPESGFDDVWMMEKAGTPAEPITTLNEPHVRLEVNEKLEADENPRAPGGGAAGRPGDVHAPPIGRAAGRTSAGVPQGAGRM
jgi:tRNA A37 methylthiotransferase MiaB